VVPLGVALDRGRTQLRDDSAQAVVGTDLQVVADPAVPVEDDHLVGLAGERAPLAAVACRPDADERAADGLAGERVRDQRARRRPAGSRG
jgi:hypothetical protein